MENRQKKVNNEGRRPKGRQMNSEGNGPGGIRKPKSKCLPGKAKKRRKNEKDTKRKI